MMSKSSLVFICLMALTLFIYCQSNKALVETTPQYLGLHDTVDYVGMENCRACHAEQYNSFIKTGMGQSFHFASKNKSAATFDHHALVYDSTNQFYYRPFWRRDSLFIKEFKLVGKDTSFQREQYIKYIVGSGQHTNSHIYEVNGFLYQAPITFYTQKGVWSLAPGFESGNSSRFNRIIGQQCMTCHNHYATFEPQSENKFSNVQLGIQCERCHGPGEAHVKAKLAGEIIDTSQFIDYSIVNPGKLSRERQMSVCQRCHLQGVMVLQDGKDYEDFKPGMHLKEVMDIYLPEYDGPQTQFIMASHSQRLQKSACYQKTEMTCLTCHNPHVSVKHTPRATFNSACTNCHTEGQTASLNCPLPLAEREQQKNNDCSACHMPTSPSIDIPNVTITDHFIRKPLTEADKAVAENFAGLNCINNDQPTTNSLSKAYIDYFEQFTSQASMLDSANYYLEKSPNTIQTFESAIHLLYLKNDFSAIIKKTQKTNPTNLKDAWTAYRIGEAYYTDGNYQKAYDYYQQAIQLKSLNLEFQSKFGSACMQLKRLAEAQKAFQKVVTENPQHIAGLNNLGFVFLNYGEVSKAEALYQKALSLNPDYEPALMNMLALHVVRKEIPQAKKLLQRVLQINPENPKARILQQQLF